MSIQVAIVDDSALMRQCLSQLLDQVTGIQVCLTAADPIAAQQKFAKYWPDVIILDLEMPHMDGLTFLKQIMSQRPTPVIILSSHVGEGAKKTVQALEAGAIDVFAKPASGLKDFLHQQLPAIADTIKACTRHRASLGLSKKTTDSSSIANSSVPQLSNNYSLIALGSSTGGTLALEQILSQLQPPQPPIVMVQHMPPNFTQALAERLNSLSALDVVEVTHPQKLCANCAYLAPGDQHMTVLNQGGLLKVNLLKHPPVNRHRPSVDVLFDSISQSIKTPILAALLTGMGQDGAKGLLRLAQTGHNTIAQDEASCVVFGMPKAAIDMGAAKHILSLNQIIKLLNNRSALG